MGTPNELGDLLRQWRARRRLSQLALAIEAEISTRHLSFIETGRARPSRPMLVRLAETLALPLRETDELMLAAGFSPASTSRVPAVDPSSSIEAPLQMLLEGHEPYPALAIDRYWTIRKANNAVAPLLAGIAPELLAPPLNAVRISLHPGGLAPRIVNFGVWRAHLVGRLKRQVALTGDAALARLLAEAEAYPAPAATVRAQRMEGPVIPMLLKSGDRVLNLISTTTIFGTPVDVEVSELAIESFFPGDEATRRFFLGGV